MEHTGTFSTFYLLLLSRRQHLLIEASCSLGSTRRKSKGPPTAGTWSQVLGLDRGAGEAVSVVMNAIGILVAPPGVCLVPTSD